VYFFQEGNLEVETTFVEVYGVTFERTYTSRSTIFNKDVNQQNLQSPTCAYKVEPFKVKGYREIIKVRSRPDFEIQWVCAPSYKDGYL
jgi:hypothetical protein